MAKPKKERAAVSRGIGESKIFRDSNGAPDPIGTLRGLHVGGKPVETLPLHDLARLSYEHTDEGIAERNAGKVHSAARVISGPLEMSIRERVDFRTQSPEPWEARDPMKEVADRYVGPGMKAKFLSPRKVARQGTRGHEIVKDEKGDPVKLGEMILAQMPVEKVQARNRAYQQRSQVRLDQMKEEFLEGQQRLIRDAVGRPRALAGGSRAGEGLDSAFSE